MLNHLNLISLGSISPTAESCPLPVICDISNLVRSGFKPRIIAGLTAISLTLRVTRHPCNVDSTFSFFTSFLTFFFFPRALPKGRLLVLIFIIIYDPFYLPNCHSFTHKYIKSCLYWPSFLCRFSVDLHLGRLPLLMVSPGTIMANGDSQMNSSVNLSIHSTQGQGSILIVSHVIFYIFIYYGINEHSLHLKQQQLLVYNI